VAVPTYVREKYLHLAADRGLPVWMLPPAARRFEEAVEIVQRFDDAQCPVVVSRSWGIEPTLQADVLGDDRVGRVFLARGDVMTCWSENLNWRGDSVRAVGGVLLDRAYGLIDTTVRVMGTPSTVYAATAGVSRPGCRFPYDTEDTGVVVCQYTGGPMALFSACWTSGPTLSSLELNGMDGSLRIDAERVVLRDRAGRVEVSVQDRPANPLIPQIEDFLSGLQTRSRTLRGQLRDHLPTMAVLHAAYLSARTGQPESPSTIFEVHDIRDPSHTPS